MNFEKFDDCPKCKIYRDEVRRLEATRNSQRELLKWMQDELIEAREISRHALRPKHDHRHPLLPPS